MENKSFAARFFRRAALDSSPGRGLPTPEASPFVWLVAAALLPALAAVLLGWMGRLVQQVAAEESARAVLPWLQTAGQSLAAARPVLFLWQALVLALLESLALVRRRQRNAPARLVFPTLWQVIFPLWLGVGLGLVCAYLFSLQGELLPVLAVPTGAPAVGLSLAFALAAPWGLELFYRRRLTAWLQPRLGWPVACLAAASVYALFTLHPGAFLPAFLISLVLSGLVRQTGSAGPAILAHAACNAALLVCGFLLPL